MGGHARGAPDIRDDPVVAAATRDTETYGTNPLAYYGNMNEYDDGNSGRIYVVKGSDPEQKAVNQRKIAEHRNPQVASARYEVNVEAKTAKMLSVEAVAKAKLAHDEI